MTKVREGGAAGFNRRALLAGAAAVGAGAFAASCGQGGGGAGGAGRPLRLGFVSPQTGPLAGFGEADNFVVAQVREVLKQGVQIAGKSVPVEILVRDSQSSPSRAAEVAGELILQNDIDLMLVSSTPETTNPVSDQCELNETPCLSTVAPWQPWLLGRGGKPDVGFQWTYHFFWGLEDVIGVFTDMWGRLPTNKSVGGLFPNDGDGNAWGDPKVGFPPVLAQKGFRLNDPGRYQNLTDDFSSQIGRFKQVQAEIVTGVVLPPDWTTFWTQAQQQNYRPKIASIGKALLFPTSAEALGPSAQNLSSEVWWTPSHPFKSSLTGQTAAQVASAYTAATKKQWTQPIGFAHALFEVAIAAAKASAGPGDKTGIRDAIARTKQDTLVGPLDWSAGPAKNVAKTPLVGGQWRRTDGGPFAYDLVVTANSLAGAIPQGGDMQAII